MNRKGEWGQNLPPTFGILGVDEDKRVRGKKRSGDECLGEKPSKKAKDNLCPPDQQMVPLPEIDTSPRPRETIQANSIMIYLQNNSKNHGIQKEITSDLSYIRSL